ncbi:MAG: phage antirepressor N-terminal domain-containing protein [Chloroflexota bacterium]|nr:phage antirepressor N-terminal domain-containing protein [Chloroflexota bacterium]
MSEPLHQRIVSFYGDELVAIQQPDGAIFVLFARLCENLGLARGGQVRRVQRHAVLSEGLVAVPVQTDGGAQEAQCLRRYCQVISRLVELGEIHAILAA